MASISEGDWARLSTLWLAGTKFEFYRHEAQVLEGRRWSETQISSSGGGGYLINGTGVVRSPKITSRTEDRAEYWVRFDDGTETSFEATSDFRCRAGQRLTLVCAVAKGNERGPFLLSYNHQTKECLELNSSYRSFIDKYVTAANAWLLWLGTIVICAFAYPVISNWRSGLNLQRSITVAATQSDYGALFAGALAGLVIGFFVPSLVWTILTNRLRQRLRNIGIVLSRHG